MALLLLISALGMGGIYAAQGEREASRRAVGSALAQDSAQMSLAKYRHLALLTASQLYQSGHPYLVNGIRPDGSAGKACNPLDYGIGGTRTWLPGQSWQESLQLGGGPVNTTLNLATTNALSYLDAQALPEGSPEGLTASRQSALFASNAAFFAHALAARRVEAQNLTLYGSIWLRQAKEPALAGSLTVASRYDPKQLGNFALSGEVCPVVRSAGDVPEVTALEPLLGVFGANAKTQAWVAKPNSPHPRVPLAFSHRLEPNLLVRPNSPCFKGFGQSFSCATPGAYLVWDAANRRLQLAGTVEFAGDLEIPAAQLDGTGILIARNLRLDGLTPPENFPFAGVAALLAREQLLLNSGLNGGIFHADRELVMQPAARVLGHISAPVVRGGGVVYGVPGLEHHLPTALEAALGPEARVLPHLLVLSDVPL
jgi:hypothetical protein